MSKLKVKYLAHELEEKIVGGKLIRERIDYKFQENELFVIMERFYSKIESDLLGKNPLKTEVVCEHFSFEGLEDGTWKTASLDTSFYLQPILDVFIEDGVLHITLLQNRPEQELNVWVEPDFSGSINKIKYKKATFEWSNKGELLKEELQQKKQTEHREKKQIAEKLIMDRMVSDYILSTELTDEEKDIFVNLFDLWEPNTAYSRGDKLVYEGLAYEIIQAHTSQSDWLPNELPALYKLLYQTSTDDGTIVIPEWKQPLGGHDTCNTGDLVFHEGKTWESTMDGNVWEPGVYGWIEYGK